MAELARALVDELGGRRGGELLIDPTRTPPSEPGFGRWIGRVLEDPARCTLVGTLDGAVVGFALGSAAETDGLGKRGRLTACYVEEGARGVGVGRLLLDRLLEWFAAQGCVGVDGSALPGDRGAKSFFESAGFKARVLTMYRPIG